VNITNPNLPAWKKSSSGKTFCRCRSERGDYTLAASRIVGETVALLLLNHRIQSLPVLRKNIALNHLTNVSHSRSPLARRGAANSTTVRPSLNSLGKETLGRKNRRNTTETLDDILERASSTRGRYQVDVQGAEELVYAGRASF